MRLMRRFQAVSPLGFRRVDRDDATAAAPLRGPLEVAPVGQEMGAGGQQERAELPPGPVHAGQEIGLDQPGEELLGQVAGRLRVVAAAADECIEGIPVGPAQLGQHPAGLRLGLVAVAGGDDPAPSRRRERRRTARPGAVGGWRGGVVVAHGGAERQKGFTGLV